MYIIIIIRSPIPWTKTLNELMYYIEYNASSRLDAVHDIVEVLHKLVLVLDWSVCWNRFFITILALRLGDFHLFHHQSMKIFFLFSLPLSKRFRRGGLEILNLVATAHWLSWPCLIAFIAELISSLVYTWPWYFG